MTDPTNPDAQRLLQVVEGLGVRFGLERSFRLCRNMILSNRFLCSVSKASLGPRPDERVLDLCRAMAMPADLLDVAAGAISNARFIHVGFEDNRTSCIYKLYLEFGLSTPVGPQPILLHIALKWGLCNFDLAVATRYHLFPALTLEDILRRIAGAPAAIRDIARLAASRMPRAPRYMEATEEDNPRRSFDLNLYDAGLRLGDLRPLLERLCEHFTIPAGEFGVLYDRIRGHALGHIASGVHRDGEGFCNIYHGVEARHER